MKLEKEVYINNYGFDFYNDGIKYDVIEFYKENYFTDDERRFITKNIGKKIKITLEIKEPILYTDTNWEDLLEYNHMTWINIDRFKELEDENIKLKELLENNSKVNVADHKYASKMEDILIEYENWLVETYFLNIPDIADNSQVKEIYDKLKELKERYNG